MSSNNLSQRRAEALVNGVSVLTPIFAQKANNSELWDINGKRYIDFISGIAVLNTGHRHPKIVQAIKNQLDNFSHTCHQVAIPENYIELAEKLNKLTPGNFKKKTLFVTTGAEAVENAIKIARYHTKRDAIIAFNGAFHGRTFMGMALTGKTNPYKKGFGSLPGPVYHVPYPQKIHNITVEDTLKAIDNLFKSDVSPDRVAAIIVEPVQGEGGFYPAPKELMQEIRKICDNHGIVMIADEVQTGFARTGKLFAMEHYDVTADLMTMAKSLAGGVPLSAVTGKAEIMDSPHQGGLGGTYGGNPLAIASSLAVLEIIEEEKLCERANVLGNKLQERLTNLAKEVPEISEVRGFGFMKAVEFFEDGKPSSEFTNRVRTIALEKGLMLLTCGIYGNVVRFLAPITIEDKIFDEALDILETSIKEARQ